MNDSRKPQKPGAWWALMFSITLFFTGCQTDSPNVVDSGANVDPKGTNRLRPNDLISVVFSGVTTPPDRFDGRIKEDGSISLPYVGKVKAEGKTVGELEKEVHDLYITNKIFTSINVNVNSENRSYSVDGEVRNPARQVYASETTVLSAIASVGGFTDFANKKKVRIIRTNGKVLFENCNKAKENPSLDLPIFPGDKIIVPRRIL
jgi:protein involved in polysaccharide export with SLBB domain